MELFVPPSLGLTCFRLKVAGAPARRTVTLTAHTIKRFQGDNTRTRRLHEAIAADGRIHLVPGTVKDVFYLRLSVCSQATDETHIRSAFNIIRELGERIVVENGVHSK